VSRVRGATGALRSAPSPFGAPPVAIFGSRVRDFRLRHCPPERVQRGFSRPSRSAQRADPVPPEAAVTSRSRRTPLPAPPPGSSREAPSTSGNDLESTQYSICSQYICAICRRDPARSAFRRYGATSQRCVSARRTSCRGLRNARSLGPLPARQ
jgi:hypothetical protein